jgi:hypothetical protein
MLFPEGTQPYELPGIGTVQPDEWAERAYAPTLRKSALRRLLPDVTGSATGAATEAAPKQAPASTRAPIARPVPGLGYETRWNDLLDQGQALRKSRIQFRTRSTYSYKCRTFITFCLIHDRPLDNEGIVDSKLFADTLLAYVAWCSSWGYKDSVIGSQVGAVVSAIETATGKKAFERDQSVWHAIKGHSQDYGEATGYVATLFSDQLSRVLINIPDVATNINNCALANLLSITHACTLRADEAFATDVCDVYLTEDNDASDPHPFSTLQPGEALLKIKRRKTAQPGTVFNALLVDGDGSMDLRFRPAALLRQWLHLTGLTRQRGCTKQDFPCDECLACGALFRPSERVAGGGSSVQLHGRTSGEGRMKKPRLTTTWVTEKLRELIRAHVRELDPATVTLRSIRRGSSTDMKLSGVPDNVNDAHGGWVEGSTVANAVYRSDLRVARQAATTLQRQFEAHVNTTTAR